ncbi:MAG: LCP family protein [Acidimicrobiales bacterium]|jgi:LCP family protein required for cell wall assembly
MTDGSNEGRHGRSHESRRDKKRALANEHRLIALGDVVDESSGVTRRKRARKPGRTRRRVIITFVVLVGLLLAVIGGGYLYAQWRFDQIKKIKVVGELPQLTGKPFNILEIGSDSRAGLTGAVAAQTGASTGSVAGQRSDVVKIMHIDPAAGTITILSIPRDTMTTLLANQSLYGKFNRINVNFGSGPSLLAQTITANFGIPITHTIVVSFGGLINAADAIGGVYLDFRYPSHDPYSGLSITHPGCQLVTGFQALAVARSRHFYYNVNGDSVWPGNNTSQSELYNLGWYYDGTSDFGRIDRQNAFLRAMISRAKGLYNPLTINSFLSKIPQGISLDTNFTLTELIELAVKFHGLNPANMLTYTLPVTDAQTPQLGDVLFVEQPEAQQMLVNIFGSQLLTPTDPAPNTALQTPLPPVVTSTTTSTTTTLVKHTHKKVPTTTTTINPSQVVPNFDPVPCTP